jgi:ribosomal protein L40E
VSNTLQFDAHAPDSLIGTVLSSFSAFPNWYSPDSQLLMCQTLSTTLAGFIAGLGILIIGGKEFFAPSRSGSAARKARPPASLSLAAKKGRPMPLRADSSMLLNMTWVPRRASLVQSCQVCKHCYAFQNKGVATCPPAETQQLRPKRRTKSELTPPILPQRHPRLPTAARLHTTPNRFFADPASGSPPVVELVNRIASPSESIAIPH